MAVLRAAKISGNNLTFKIKIKKFNVTHSLYITDDSDLDLLKEIFFNNEYHIEIDKEPEVILDLGSNVGMSVLYFNSQYPNAKIYAFEPNPEVYHKLLLNTQSIKNIYCHNQMISDTEGQQILHINQKQSMSSSIFERKGNDVSVIIESVTIDSIMNRYGFSKVDLVKFDIEGAEYITFKSCRGLHRICNLIGEVHLDLINKTRQEFEHIFEGFRFETRKKGERASRFLSVIRNQSC